MKRSTLLIAILLICTNAFAQKPHPKDKEIEAAILAYYKSLDTMVILEEFKYVESIDISEKEYRGMAAGKFESYMFISKYNLKEGREEQERIKKRKRQNLNDIELQKKYDDTLAQLADDQKMWQDMYDRNKVSLDSCNAIVKMSDSVNTFGYLSFALVKARNIYIHDPSAERELLEFIVTKDMQADIYIRLEKEQLAFIRE